MCRIARIVMRQCNGRPSTIPLIRQSKTLPIHIATARLGIQNRMTDQLPRHAKKVSRRPRLRIAGNRINESSPDSIPGLLSAKTKRSSKENSITKWTKVDNIATTIRHS